MNTMEQSETCSTTKERIISIPSSVTNRKTNEVVKDAVVQLKIHRLDEKAELQIVVACEEGIFLQAFSQEALKNCKTKPDLDQQIWMLILDTLLQVNLFAQTSLPTKYSTVTLQGKLYSLENYDPETGQLNGDDLCEEPPEFELYVKTEGRLPVTLGMMVIPNKDPENCTNDETDMLLWLLIASHQIELLRQSLLVCNKELQMHKDIANIKEQEIKEVTSDYQMILTDLQDRFFQVLNEKKKKILQLEGNPFTGLDILNSRYKERSKLNLNRVNIEDIVIGEGSKQYGERKKRKKSVLVKKTRISVPKEHAQQVKKGEYESENDQLGGFDNEKVITNINSNDDKMLDVKEESNISESEEIDTDYDSDEVQSENSDTERFKNDKKENDELITNFTTIEAPHLAPSHQTDETTAEDLDDNSTEYSDS